MLTITTMPAIINFVVPMHDNMDRFFGMGNLASVYDEVKQYYVKVGI